MAQFNVVVIKKICPEILCGAVLQVRADNIGLHYWYCPRCKSRKFKWREREV
jgi:hypothetical protein